MKYIGYENAIKLGYSLYSHNGNNTIASYYKDKLCLTVYIGGSAKLSTTYKMINLDTGKFSFPHPRFELFENQIMYLLNGVK